MLSAAVQVSKFPLSVMFAMCSLFLGVAATCQRWLESITAAENSKGDYELVDNNASTLLASTSAADADKALTAV